MLTGKNNKIYPYSRTFLFPFSRPFNQKLLNPKKLEHKKLYLIKNILISLEKNLIKKNLKRKLV